MSEAHEKTRIRQLEDAVAHWEYKYANARQYNRNLEERNQRLEAALREIAEHGDTYAWRIAQKALGLTAETACDHDWVEVDAYPFREKKCTKCGATMSYGKTTENRGAK